MPDSTPAALLMSYNPLDMTRWRTAFPGRWGNSRRGVFVPVHQRTHFDVTPMTVRNLTVCAECSLWWGRVADDLGRALRKWRTQDGQCAGCRALADMRRLAGPNGAEFTLLPCCPEREREGTCAAPDHEPNGETAMTTDPVPPVDLPSSIPHPSDLATSFLRTYVPVAWGTGITWLATFAKPVADLLDTPGARATATAVAIAGWYMLWRWVEPKLPTWLTRLFLGSNRQPNYKVPSERAA